MTAPAAFISHGSPMTALARDGWTAALGRLGERAAPRAVLVVSAHWPSRGAILIGATASPETIHDFGGFPDALYELRYPAHGAPDVARRASSLLESAGFATRLDETRGLDHGAWVPLRFVLPDARTPVFQVSLPRDLSPERLAQVGKALAPLRDENVMIVGTGGVTHNLGLVYFEDEHAPVDAWAAEFDAWVKEKLAARDLSGLARWRDHLSGARAHPTSEHLDPLFVVLGAARPGDTLEHLDETFRHGNLSMRSFAFSS